jgi:integrase
MKSQLALFKSGQVWHYRYRLDGVRVQRSTGETVKVQAQAIADEAWEVAKAHSRGEEPEPTLGRLVELWVAAHALEVSPSRIGTMTTFGKMHISTLRDLYLRDLDPRTVQAARAAYQAGHSRNSTNLWLNCLNTLVGWAVRCRMIRQKPWQLRKLKVQKKPKVQLPVRQASAWMTEVDRLTPADAGLALAIRLCLGMGLRVNEAVAARWEWLDWERKTYTPGRTKGREAKPRPVVPWLLEELQPRQTVGFMLPTRPGHPITDKRIRYVMGKANRNLGLPNITPHRLRGTYATLLAVAGTPIQDIQAALGHESILTTQGYLEVDVDRIRSGQISISGWLNLPRRGMGAPKGANPHEAEIGKFPGEISKDAQVLKTGVPKVRRIGK